MNPIDRASPVPLSIDGSSGDIYHPQHEGLTKGELLIFMCMQGILARDKPEGLIEVAKEAITQAHALVKVMNAGGRDEGNESKGGAYGDETRDVDTKPENRHESGSHELRN